MSHSMESIINRIKNRRIELELSYQDLADKTGLSKSTLQRYETGSIKNMPLDKVEVLATALNVKPMWILGYEDLSDNKQINKEPLLLEESKLLKEFKKLNSVGKSEAIKRVSELTEINKYIISDRISMVAEETLPYAAHDKKGTFTEEDYKHDDDIMNNDGFWEK